MLHRVTRAAVILVAIACSSSSPTLEPTPKRSDGSATPALPRTTSGRWVLVPEHSPRSYVSSTTTFLELTSDGTSIRDSIFTLIDFTISTTADPDSPKLAGTISKYFIQAGNRIEQPDLSLVLPLSFVGHFENGRLLLDSAGKEQVTNPARCTNSTRGVLTSIQRNFIVPPAILTTGLSWTDSLTVPACSGSIPLTLSIRRAYTVAGEINRDGHRVLLIQRTEETVAAGEGAQGQHRVTLNSRGSGLTSLYFDYTTGDLVSLQGEQRSHVEVTSSGRVQRFTQLVHEKIALRSDS